MNNNKTHRQPIDLMTLPPDDPLPLNPYASPLAENVEAQPRSPARHESIGFLKILNQTSVTLTDNLGTFLILAGIQFLAFILFYLCVLFWVVVHLTVQPAPDTEILIVTWGARLIPLLLAGWCVAGIVRVALPMLRGENYSSSQALAVDGATLQICLLWLPSFGIQYVGDSLWRTFGDQLDPSAFALGFAAVHFCVPLFLALTPQFIVDRKMWIWEAAIESVLRVGPNFVSLAAAFLTLSLILAFAVPFTLSFGILLVVPIWVTFFTIAYLQATGDRVVLDATTQLRQPKPGEAAPKIAPPVGFEK